MTAGVTAQPVAAQQHTRESVELLPQLRRDYERVVLSGAKRIRDDDGNALLEPEVARALGRLVEHGLASREDDAFVLQVVRDTTLQVDDATAQLFDTLHTIWLRLDSALGNGDGDEVLYGELGYWQHWWNTLNDGTDRAAHPLRMDLMLPEHGTFLSRQWASDLDPELVNHVFSGSLVTIRVLVPPSALGSNAETIIEQSLPRGVEVRVFQSEAEFSIYDGSTVVLRDEGQPGALERHRMTRRRSMVEPLVQLFEARWAAAIPWESFTRGGGGILHLMAKGMTDPAIADTLGLSPRTVSRRVAEMMDAAGVRSRFELGMKFALGQLTNG